MTTTAGQTRADGTTVGALVEFVLGHTTPGTDSTSTATGHDARVEALIDTLVDTVAVTIGGAETDAVQSLRFWIEPSVGASPVWGVGQRLAPSRAALINGTAAHALDYDDAGLTMPIHPSAVLWPAVLALSGPHTPTAHVLAAVEAGHIVFRALADVLPMSEHYGRGWHATSTIGVLAATAAGAAVAGLTPEEARSAIGVAASTAAGGLSNFGTMTKPFHAGRAASDAVMAVGLAQAGFTANPDELDDPRGFLARYGDPAAAAEQQVDLRERLAYWTDNWVADCAIKQFAACFGTHRALAAAVRLRPALADLTASGDPLAEVADIQVEAHPATLRPLRTELPTTGDEAKFSMAFNVAQALRTGGVGPGDFTPEAIATNAELMALVTTTAADAPSAGNDAQPVDLGGRRFAQVTLTLTDGRQLSELVTLDRPEDRPTPEAIDDKFVRCLTAVGVPASTATTLPAQVRAAAAAPTLDDLLALLALPLIQEES